MHCKQSRLSTQLNAKSITIHNWRIRINKLLRHCTGPRAQGPGPAGPKKQNKNKHTHDLCFTEWPQIGVHRLEIGCIGIIVQCMFFLFRTNPRQIKQTYKKSDVYLSLYIYTHIHTYIYTYIYIYIYIYMCMYT